MEDMLNSLPLTLTVSEVAKLLRIGKNNTYALINSGEIRCIRIGRCIKVPRSAVFEFLEKKAV